MKRQQLVLALILALPAAFARPAALAAQGSSFVRPAVALDAPHAAARNSLVALRDSLLGIRSGIARLQRDDRQASPITLEARARTIQRACVGAGLALPSAQTSVSALKAETAGLQRVKGALLDEMKRAQATLTACGKDWGAMGARGKGEEVRGYGRRRSDVLSRALYSLDGRLGDFGTAFALGIRPAGAPKSDLAS